MIKPIQLLGFVPWKIMETPISLDVGSEAFSLLLTRLMEAFTTVASVAPKSDFRDTVSMLDIANIKIYIRIYPYKLKEARVKNKKLRDKYRLCRREP